ncbi:MAG: hypothetical protein GX036_00600 [Firmicutes bacterium]|jgi:hypothetical protein|nr:hypothetical protein [Bacillota bacterium]
MVQPIDLQVLLNRALEVQRTQAVTLRQPVEESENFKNRTNQEIEEEERQVRRKKEKVHGRVEEEKNRFRGRDSRDGQKKKRQGAADTKKHWPGKEKGQLIDMEV